MFLASSPKEYFVVVPPRAVYSHSSSVGNLISALDSISFAARMSSVALRQKALASSSESISTEFRLPFHLLGLLPITASHKFWGTSYLAMENLRASDTSRVAPSSPILNDRGNLPSPGVTAINSSRKVLRSAACSAESSPAASKETRRAA